jgi:hypothetical protein
LAPEYGPPQQQPPSDGPYPYGPPQSYAQPQQHYQQQPPTYQDPYQASAPPYPTYQQPAFGQPGPGVPPPPPPRRGKGLKITLGILGALFLVCALGCGIFLWPVLSASGTTVTAPATLPGGLNKETSDTMQKIVDEMERDLRNDVGDVDQVAAGIYTDGDATKPVIVVAATSTIVFPDSEVDDAFKGFGSSTSGSVGSPVSYPAGDLGGTVKCATGEDEEVAMTLCAWADHGSVGIAIFIGRDLAEASDLFLKIRPAVETR